MAVGASEKYFGWLTVCWDEKAEAEVAGVTKKQRPLLWIGEGDANLITALVIIGGLPLFPAGTVNFHPLSFHVSQGDGRGRKAPAL
jgi:hypothetical protein